jgi:hypothetical protein
LRSPTITFWFFVCVCTDLSPWPLALLHPLLAEATKDSLEAILRWDFDQVSVCHGSFISSGGKQALRDGSYAFVASMCRQASSRRCSTSKAEEGGSASGSAKGPGESAEGQAAAAVAAVAVAGALAVAGIGFGIAAALQPNKRR